MEHETAGDPVSGLKWTRKTTAKIAQQLKRISIQVSAKTVGRLLKQMNFSLRNPVRVNRLILASAISSFAISAARYVPTSRRVYL